MNWIHPEWLWTTALLIPITAVVLVTGWWHRRRIRDAFGPELSDRVLPRSVRIRRTLRDLGALLALLCGAFALAEPAFDKAISQQKVKGVDMVIALDLSRSMDAQDLDPNRLERARREIIDLLGQVTGDRVAVVFFAGDAISRLPLTEDYRAVEWLLQEANTSMFTGQGSNLARAIEVSRELLSRDEGKAGKAMVVFSDGETHEPDAALAAADEGAAEGMMIYTVGIGDAKASIPSGNGPLRHKGQVVYTEPDFTTLREVAIRTGGAYVKSVASSSDMRGLYAAIRKGVKAVERDSVARESWNSAYQVPLGMGLLFWLGGAWLGEGRRRFGAAAVVLAVGLSSGVAHAVTPAEADALYRSDRLPAAESAFEELSLQDPGNADLFRRLGAVRYRMEDYVGAAAAFERANALAGGDAESLYNAGNARYRAGQLETALERYDEAIGQSQHAPSKANREVVAGELQARRAEQPPPPPPPPPSEGGGEEEEKSDGEGEPQDDSEGGGGEKDQDSQSDGDQEGDQQSDGQQGENEGQENEEQDGSADSEGDKAEQDKKDPSEGEGQGSESEEAPGEEDSDGVNPDQLDDSGESGDDGEANASGEPGEGTEETSGNITPAQAARMIDGVEEGQMRVRMVGAASAKPW